MVEKCWWIILSKKSLVAVNTISKTDVDSCFTDYSITSIAKVGWQVATQWKSTEIFSLSLSQNHHPTIDWIEVPDFFQRLQHNAWNARQQTLLATKLMLLTFLRTVALVRMQCDWINSEKTNNYTWINSWIEKEERERWAHTSSNSDYCWNGEHT